MMAFPPDSLGSLKGMQQSHDYVLEMELENCIYRNNQIIVILALEWGWDEITIINSRLAWYVYFVSSRMFG